MAQLLAEDNPCGDSLLHLVSRGNAIIAEILRLKDHVPPLFKLETKPDQQKYGAIICDFIYFRKPEDIEKPIERNATLQELDNEVRDTHMEILARFFVAFESVHKYANDINQFMEELEDGFYIQQTLDTLLSNVEGKQLLCEMLFLYGVMLLLIDIHIEGVIRERLLVSYYRYCAQQYSTSTTVDDVCKLMRSTTNSNKRPLDYPVDYFKRVEINEMLISVVIARLRTDDVYNQIVAYPNTDHRSTALATQASMLFVCLFFNPSILHQQSARMREIVDKYFPDSWVVNVYMGFTINLIEAWENFKAAKSALGNTIEFDNITYQANTHTTQLKKCLKETKHWLKEGAMVEEKVISNVEKIISICRECNVTLRWMIMHTAPKLSIGETNKKCKVVRDQVLAVMNNDQLALLDLLLNTAEMELNTRDLIKTLLQEKDNKWNTCKNECIQRMMELSEAFSGDKPLTRLEKNENLQEWFKKIASQIESLSMDKVRSSVKKIVQLMQALDEVQSFHELSARHQVSEFLSESRKQLLQMKRTIEVREQILIDLQIIGDLSYAWNLIDNFTLLMQTTIKNDPSVSIKLRATFLKLSSALESPLLRINQAGSEDLVSVSEYYSQQLVEYISRVLHIIPETMFQHMSNIITLQTKVIKQVPTRLEKEKLKDYAQLQDRMQVSKETHAVSILSEGILKMKSTLVGIVTIDPKKLLEQGIRKELVKHIATALDCAIVFNPKSKGVEFRKKLEDLSETIDGYQRSFEYIEDYIGICGVKIWKEELSRVIAFNVQMECNNITKNKMILPPIMSNNNDDTKIDIPIFTPKDNQSINFIGRLARELIRITDPKTTIYVEKCTSWFDIKTQEEVLNIKIFSQIKSSIGISGLTGLDKLFGFIIVKKLQIFLYEIENKILKEKFWIDLLTSLDTMLNPNTSLIENPSKTYGQYLGKVHRIPNLILDTLVHVGQLQILRKLIFHELHISCKSDSKIMFSCLDTLNRAVLNDIKLRNVSTPASSLLKELSGYLDWAGIGNCYSQIYVTTNHIVNFSSFMFLFVAYQFSKLQWMDKPGNLVWKKCGDPLDGVPLIIGVVTLFRQLHPIYRDDFLSYLSQYFKSHLSACASNLNKNDMPAEVMVCLEFLRSFMYHSGLPETLLGKYIPESAIDILDIISDVN